MKYFLKHWLPCQLNRSSLFSKVDQANVRSICKLDSLSAEIQGKKKTKYEKHMYVCTRARYKLLYSLDSLMANFPLLNWWTQLSNDFFNHMISTWSLQIPELFLLTKRDWKQVAFSTYSISFPDPLLTVPRAVCAAARGETLSTEYTKCVLRYNEDSNNKPPENNPPRACPWVSWPSPPLLTLGVPGQGLPRDVRLRLAESMTYPSPTPLHDLGICWHLVGSLPQVVVADGVWSHDGVTLRCFLL